MPPKIKIVYFGTPDFAAHILREMIAHDYDIRGVVTMPDKPAGRGHHLKPSAVKEVATDLLPDVPILQPESLRDSVFLRDLRALDAELFVVVAFRMLPPEVWQMPKCGTFNLHASLLPLYRGAAPIQYAILNGDTETGVTTFFLDEKIDTGQIILRKTVSISPDETGGSLHDKLMVIGAGAVRETIDRIAEHPRGVSEISTPQSAYLPRYDEADLPTAPKIFKEDRILHFSSDNAIALERRQRAMSPYPTALLVHEDGTEYKVFSARIAPDTEHLSPGEYRVIDGHRLLIGTKKGAIEILELQAPSKKRTFTQDYLRGNTLPEGRFL